MYSRIVDGDALWGSKKLRNVPEKFRAEYANLLPLSNSWGYFEYDAQMIWAKVYACNRNNITVQYVDEMLEAFVKADMISINTASDGKVYGFFVGIDKKEGRLPSMSRRSMLKDNYPSPEDF